MSVPQSASSPADRRRYVREQTHEVVTLVTLGGHAHVATVVDRSLSGMRIEFEQVADLPRELKVLSPRLGAIHMARLVWRTVPYGGLSISRTIDMRTVVGGEAAEMHRLWRDHIGR